MEDKEKKSFINGLFSGIMVTVLAGTALFCGSRLVSAYRGQQAQTVSGENAAGQGTVVTDSVIHKMSAIEQIIDTYFYHQDIDLMAMEDGIYGGMVESLEDPYSTYYSKEELEQILDKTEGIYYGIGAYIGLDTDTGLPRISGIMPGTPAETAGLREGDLIYMIDGGSAAGLESSEVVSKIKGEEGTKVHLTLIRESESNYIEADIERKRVESPTVSSSMLGQNVGYIKIKEFDEVTLDQFTEALAVCKGSGMEGLILDLRSNPGGNLRTVIEIAKEILPEGLVVYTEDRDGRKTEYRSDGQQSLQVPMVVLINGYSASASEILAGAIKDHGAGALVGTTSYGKGIVQRIISLKDGSAIKLTVSNYFTPSGKNIHGVGIEPDIVCEFDSDAYYDNGADNQLEKAEEVLKDLMKDRR